MNKARNLALGSLAVGSLVLGGCVSWPSYPANWPALGPVVSAGCADVTGDYAGANPYRYPDQGGRPPTLGILFEIAGSDRVKIAVLRSGDLEVAVWYGDRPGPNKLLSHSAGDYDCSPEGIRLRKVRGWAPYPNYTYFWGWGSNTLILKKTVDGSLVVRSEGSVAGFVVIAPLVKSGRFWHRFPPYQSPPARS
jgi:hypothetical protein